MDIEVWLFCSFPESVQQKKDMNYIEIAFSGHISK